MMADSSDVDAAVCARLGNDPTLAALMPDGVWMDLGPPGLRKFVIVARIEHHDENIFEQRTAWETFTYLVKAVALGSSGTEVKQAAARIHELLQNATLTPIAYLDMRCQRAQAIRLLEPDEISGERWQHRGAFYEVWVQPQ